MNSEVIGQEVLFISNANELDEDLELQFNNEFLNYSECHRHLGVTFNYNGKWNDNIHVEKIYKSVMKKVNVLRKLCMQMLRHQWIKSSQNTQIL